MRLAAATSRERSAPMASSRIHSDLSFGYRDFQRVRRM